MNTPLCAMTGVLRHPGQGLVGFETSPAWHMPNHRLPTLVKTEPLSLDQDHQDRHSPINDSGISQDHGSSSSGPSPPFKPSPPASQPDSTGMIRINSPYAYQVSSPVYPPPRRPSPLTAPGEDNSRSSSEGDQGYYREGGALKNLQAALERTGSSLCPDGADCDQDEEKLQCPLCAFTSTSRQMFHRHLGTHYEHKCTLCDFTAQGVDTLRVHMRDEHDRLLSPETEPEAGDNENDGSMDGDEPGVRVPRVNSQGKVKTFRCKQCDFVSVTKLVFWEHSRTHIKQEKLLTCPKCPFVTEYKHHLEYHLRNHFGSKPFKCDKCSYSCVNKSMLNSHLKSHSNVYQYRCADCTYATKYCHSLKLHLRKYTHKPAMVLNPDGSPNPLPIIDVYGTRRGPKLKPKEDDSAPPTLLPGQFQMYQTPFMIQPPQVPFPYGPLMNAFPHNPPFPAFPHHQAQEKGPEQASMERIMSFVNNNNNNNQPEDYMTKMPVEESILDVVGGVEEEKVEEERMEEGEGTPLDLSRAEPEVTATPSIGNKSRRKGKAFKLERIAMKLQHRPDEEDDDEAEESPQKKVASEEAMVEPPKAGSPPAVESDLYNCQFCDIAFRDIVMYTMHMGYHGFQDPFKCNMCGQQTSDKVSFFLHIARTSHC